MSVLQIGICDDDNIFIKILKEEIKKQIAENKYCLNINIRCFNNGESLLNAAKEISFHLLFLDIEMPEKSGFSIAESIALSYSNTSVIFVSSHENFVFASYEYSPLWFIRKSTLCGDLSLALRKYIRENRVKYLTYKTDKGVVKHDILQKDIMYFESMGHEILVKTQKGKHKIYGSLKGIETEIENNDFIRIHRSFLVNIKYINHVTGKSVELIDGTLLDLGRAFKNKLKEKIGI